MKTENTFSGHRRILAEFIRLYRNEPCLWMTKCPDYRDRVCKDTAYERLVVKLKELDSTADRDKVVKKINSLRTNWRKEKKKIEEACLTSQQYKPRLWYFHLFDFLEEYPPDSAKYDQYEPIEETEDDEYTLDTLDYEELQSDEPTEQGYIEEYEPKPAKAVPKILEAKSSFVPTSPSNISKSSTLPTATNHSNQQLEKRSRSTDDEEQRLSFDSYAAHRKRVKLQEDRHEAFGRNVAMKLRHIADKTQRLLAEKLINDALFMAEMGELNMAHGVTSFDARAQPQYETEYVSAPMEQYEAVPQQEPEIEVVNKLPPSNRRMQELQEMSRSILRRI